MRKSVIVCCALMLACSSAAVLTACGDDEAQEMFATYETWQDGFYNINMMDGFGRISRSDEQAHGGEYSAKLQPLGSHTGGEAPYFYYPMQIEGGGGYNYTDFSRLDNISFWMYNAESEEVSFELCIVASVADVYGTDCKAVQEVTLAPGQWTQVTYQPDYEALQDMCDITNVAGFAFRFVNQNSSDIADAPVLYLDDLAFSVSEEPLAEIKTSTPARGEIQSFDLASSMVYVRLQSGLDYSESYLAAGSDKLPQGAKGGIEFTVTDAEMGTWPRLHFDSRTPQTELQDADRFSLMLYFGTSDPAVTEAELHMFPDTSSEYVEYVPTNEWTKVVIDSETMLNNWGDSVGVRSLGLFWLQNGGTSCFNAIDVVRVADIRAEFDEVRIPDLSDGSAGSEYTLPEATLEIDGTPVVAESWSYDVTYRNAELCGEFPEIELNGRSFTPAYGGTYVAVYTAQYQGRAYTAEAAFTVTRRAAAEGELESFDDPAVLDTIRMNSGTGVEYTAPEYLWAGDSRLDGASEGTKGGVEYTIPDVDGGTWPRFYFISRASSDAIAKYDTVSFDIYLDAPGHDEAILVKMYPETAEQDKYVQPNTWVTVTLDAAEFADLVSRVSTESVGFFWVQNGARETGAVNIIDHIRIANIRAFNIEDERGEAAENEIEFFDDEYSLGNLTVSSASLEWDPATKSAVATFDSQTDLWLDVSVTARRDRADYEALRNEGYNAVTLEVYLQAADGTTARNAQMQYWASQNDLKPSQASVAVGEWVTLTFDLDTYLTAMQSGKTVKLLWVASSVHGSTNARLSAIKIRNVQVAKVNDAVMFGDGAEDFFLLEEADGNSADVGYEYFEAGNGSIPEGLPQSVQENGAVKITPTSSHSYAHLKFNADRNLFASGNTVTLTLYIQSSGSGTLSVRQWPHGADWLVKAEIPVNQWVEWTVDAEVLRTVFNWAPYDGIEYTDLFWFENNNGVSVSGIWIAGLRVSQQEKAAFSESGIEMENSTGELFESGETDWNAWFGIVGKKGYSYLLTIRRGATVLRKDTDYTVNGDDGSVTLLNPEPGEYTFVFESNGGCYETGSYTVTVTEKKYTVVAENGAGKVGELCAIPQATLQGATEGVPVDWSYAVTLNGSSYTVTDGTFMPDQAGTYTIAYTATYRGKQFMGRATVEITEVVAEVEVPTEGMEGVAGEKFTIPGATLKLDGSVETDGVTWSYTVSYDGEGYDDFYGDIDAADGTFIPRAAGTYTITYTATYGDDKTASGTGTITVSRKAAAAGEIESFDDLSALGNVRLESGADFAETYLAADSGNLPAGAQYGVSFAVTDGDARGNWPNLYFTAVRMSADKIKEYDNVVIPMYIGVKAESGIAQVQIEVNEVNKVCVIVKTNTWVNVILDASYFADRGAESILWIQNGGDGVVNQVNEVRIAGVYAANADSLSLLDMNTVGAFTGGNVWADNGMSGDTDTTDRYTHRSLAPEGMPEGYERAVKFNADTTTADQWPNVYARTLSKAEVQSYIAQGYAVMSFWLYVEVPQDSVRTDLQIKLLPDGGAYSEQNIAVGQWVKVEVALSALVDQMNESTGQVRLFWATVPASGNDPITAIWMTGFAFENPDRIDIVDFSSDATASFDPAYTTGWVESTSLPGSANVPQNGAVKISAGTDGINVRVHSDVDKELYRSGYTAKILVYFESGSDAEISYSTVHNGYVTSETQKVTANTWVEVEVPAYQEGRENDLYDVYNWFVTDGVDYTGWLAVGADQNVTAIYVAGVWLESPAAD